MSRRSNAPVFWALFGGGGMLAALAGPVIVFVAGIALPLGLLLPTELQSYENMLEFARHPAGKIFLLTNIVLFAWHAAHRIYKSLHDIGIHPGPVPKLVCYGSAMAVSVAALGAAVTIGF